MTFKILVPDNTAVITLSDPRANNSDIQEWATEATHKAIRLAILMYAHQRGIAPDSVGYRVKLPAGMNKMPEG